MLLTVLRAFQGRLRWIKIKRKYNVDSDNVYVIMLPDSDRTFNEIALNHIDDFLSYRKANKVVILTTDEWVFDNAHNFSNCIKAVEQITLRDYYYYRNYCYYYYYSFSDQFIMMSLQDLYGKRLALAEGVSGIEKTDMACMALYIIRNWSKKEACMHG